MVRVKSGDADGYDAVQLAYAVAKNSLHGLKGWGLVVFVLGIMVDFGLLGGGARGRGARRRIYRNSP